MLYQLFLCQKLIDYYINRWHSNPILVNPNKPSNNLLETQILRKTKPNHDRKIQYQSTSSFFRSLFEKPSRLKSESFRKPDQTYWKTKTGKSKSEKTNSSNPFPWRTPKSHRVQIHEKYLSPEPLLLTCTSPGEPVSRRRGDPKFPFFFYFPSFTA